MDILIIIFNIIITISIISLIIMINQIHRINHINFYIVIFATMIFIYTITVIIANTVFP